MWRLAAMRLDISIHALLAESDAMFSRTAASTFSNFYPRSPCGERPAKVGWTLDDSSISIHALLAESDDTFFFDIDTGELFLSTLSLRRATLQSVFPLADGEHFYPRSPCGERRF